MQFMECIFVQSNGISSASLDVDSLASFIANRNIFHVYVTDAFNITGLVTAAVVNAVSSACDLENGPYVASISPHGSTLGVTPALRRRAVYTRMCGRASCPAPYLAMRLRGI
jgi:hypothetical protein